MLLIGFISGLALLWLVLDLAEVKWRGGLMALESQHPPQMAAMWLRVASGFKVVLADEDRGLFVWERGRRFHDGGLFYYAELWRDARTGRARFVVGVMGHAFHTAAELAQARSRFVSSQLFHLTARSAENAVIRAADPRTARRVHPAMRRCLARRGLARQSRRPPAIDTPMSPSAVRFSLRVPLSELSTAIAGLSQSGWRLVETASLNRGLIGQHRYCFRDAAGATEAPDYLLEVCGYPSGWVKLAIDWFPQAELVRPPRRPTDLEADIRRAVERVHTVPDFAI